MNAALLLSALPALSLALAVPTSNNLATRQLTPAALLYPAPFNPSTCPASQAPQSFGLGTTWPDPKTEFKTTFDPNTSLDPGADSEIIGRSAGGDICSAVASFVFSALPRDRAPTRLVTLYPGVTYVLSVAADVAIEKIVAWAEWPVDEDGFRGAQFLAEARPGQTAGTLQLVVGAATQVWFALKFSAAHGNGEVALFTVGPQ